MRILFTRFPLESAMGGAEVQTLSLMEGLRARGHDVEFLGSCPVLLAECRKRNIPVTELHIGPPPVTPWHAVSFLWRQRSMRKKIIAALTDSRLPPDAVCMLSLSEKILLTDDATKSGAHVLWIEHDRVGNWLRKNPWLSRLRRLSRQATTVTVSELSRKMYLEMGWGEEDVVAIPNGIDLQRFRKIDSPLPTGRRREGEGPGARIGCVARLTRDKGVDVLIDAMKAIPQAQLTILGQGREEATLRSLIVSKQLTDRVHIMDAVDDLEMFYRSLDLLVLPSRDHDPFGLVAAEAMSLGIPAIVTDRCGIAGYLHDGIDALVVEAGSAGALAHAIKQLTDPRRHERIGAAGRRTAHEQFSLQTMIDEYEKLLESGYQH